AVRFHLTRAADAPPKGEMLKGEKGENGANRANRVSGSAPARIVQMVKGANGATRNAARRIRDQSGKLVCPSVNNRAQSRKPIEWAHPTPQCILTRRGLRVESRHETRCRMSGLRVCNAARFIGLEPVGPTRRSRMAEPARGVLRGCFAETVAPFGSTNE